MMCRALVLFAGLAASALVLLGGTVGEVRAENEARGGERAAAPASFAELLARFGDMPGLEARFVEEKHLELLAAPLRSRGRLYFAPPALLLRRVEEPRRSDVLVTPSHVRISQGGHGGREGEDTGERTQVIDLASRDEVRPLVESMLWIFAGDRESLERAYRVDYARIDGSGGDRWRLRLRPRGAPLDQLIQELRIHGSGVGAETIEVIEAGGDRTVTRILEADPERRFDAAERRALFGPAAR